MGAGLAGVDIVPERLLHGLGRYLKVYPLDILLRLGGGGFSVLVRRRKREFSAWGDQKKRYQKERQYDDLYVNNNVVQSLRRFCDSFFP